MKTEVMISVLVSICLAPNLFASTKSCAEFLNRTTVKLTAQDRTYEFTAYLAKLLESQIIGDRELARLIDGLGQGTLANPISQEDTRTSSSLYIHRAGLEEYIKSDMIDQARLFEWAQNNLKEKSRVLVKREEARIETQDAHARMEFNKVEPGDYEIKNGDKRIRVKVEAFEMMSTPVTQKQWSVIIEHNPSRHVEGNGTIVLTINGKAIKMQPDNPVEQVSWDEVQKYISRLNELSESDDPKLYQLIPSHSKEDRYRLPTDSEWTWVITNRGRPAGRYYFGNDEADLKDHVWYRDNADDTTHPVAVLKPLVVDGKEFYDMMGNVFEWVENLAGTQDRVIRGGSYLNLSHGLHSGLRHDARQKWGHPEVGFRLVRTHQ